MIFGYFLAMSRIPSVVSDFLLGLQVPRYVIFLGVIILYIIAGMFMDMVAFMFSR